MRFRGYIFFFCKTGGSGHLSMTENLEGKRRIEKKNVHTESQHMVHE